MQAFGGTERLYMPLNLPQLTGERLTICFTSAHQHCLEPRALGGGGGGGGYLF